MKSNPLVSVIVPIYKVEKYIYRCVDSIINQTYENLEIILVNDGSPDRCGEMAEEYSRQDPRIKVIHKKNGGLSDARNYGMKMVTGEYTVFLDSDDWMEHQAIEYMVEKAKEYEADIVQSAFYYAYDGQLFIDNRHYRQKDAPVLLPRQELMQELVKNEVVKNFAWGKLYKTEIIKEIPFQKGVLFEDVFWAHQVMNQVNHYLILHKPIFYYYQRGDSIVANYTPKNLDFITGLLERHAFLEKKYPSLIYESYKQIVKASLIHYRLLLANRHLDQNGYYRLRIRQYLEKNEKVLKKAIKNDRDLERQLFIFLLHPYCHFLYLGMRKGLRKAKILNEPTGLEQVKST